MADFDQEAKALNRQAQAAKALLDSIRSVDPEDEVLALDVVEGETDLFEVIDAILLRRAATLALADGTKGAVADLQQRQKRFEDRAAYDRTLIEQAMALAELKTLQRPCATLSMADRKASLVITTEADIPAKFWKPGDPTLDRKALAAALAELGEGEAIPGATLSNGAPTLTIRVK
jgi:hypothetical protein